MKELGLSSSSFIDVVFLDIDGVIFPFGDREAVEKSSCGAIFPDSALKSLGDILETTGAKLVLSSTWRAKPAFINDIIDSFRKYGDVNGGILSTVDFHDTTDVHYHGERQFEIYKWLIHHKEYFPDEEVRAWVALDDEELLEGEENVKHKSCFLGHVVKTISSIGLTPDDATKAIVLLKAQVNEYI